MTRVDPPWWWKPWLHLHPVRDWWYRPRSVSQLATAERDHLNRVVAKRESAAKAVEEALDFAASETYTDEEYGIVVAARKALRVLEGTEEGGCG